MSTSSCLAWASSWATTESDLVLVDVVDEVVVDDHPARGAEAGHVGVQRRRTPRRVGDEHVVHLDALLVRQRQDLGAQRAVRQRLEVVEQRLDQQRVDERAEQHQAAEHSAGDGRPGARPPARARRPARSARSRWPPRPRASVLTRSTANPPRPGCDSPYSRTSGAAARANGRVTSRPTRASATTATTTRHHQGPGTRSTNRAPSRVKPSTQATTSETASEAPAPDRGPSGRSPRRADLLGGETEDAAGGCSGPPGTGSHGTSSDGEHDERDGPDRAPRRAPTADAVTAAGQRQLRPRGRCAARSCSRCLPPRGQLGLGEAEQLAQLAVELPAADTSRRAAPARPGRPRRRAPGRPSRRSRRPPRGGSARSNSAWPGRWSGGAVAPDLLDDLAGRGRDRQVDVVQRDVVREPLEQPQRHPAGQRRAGGDVGRLVAHHDLAADRLEVVVDGRVDEDVHRGVRRDRAVHRRRDRGDVGVAARLGGQRGVQARPRSPAPRPPAARPLRQHPSYDGHGRVGAPGQQVRLRRPVRRQHQRRRRTAAPPPARSATAASAGPRRRTT